MKSAAFKQIAVGSNFWLRGCKYIKVSAKIAKIDVPGASKFEIPPSQLVTAAEASIKA